MMIANGKRTGLEQAAGVRRPSAVDALSLPQEKPRGLLSFLTWPFALAQLFVVDDALGAMLRRADADDPRSDGHDAQPQTGGGGDADQPLPPADRSGTIDIAASSNDGAQSHAALTSAIAAGGVGSLFRPDTASAAPAMGHAVDAPSGGGGAITASDFGAYAAAHPGLGDDGIGSSGQPGHDALSSGISAEFGAATVPTLVGDALDHVEPFLQSDFSVLTTLSDAATGLVGDVATTLTATADAVTGLADHLVADAAPLVEGALSTVADTVDAVTSLAGHVAADVAPIADPALATVGDAANAVTGLAGHIIADADSVLTLPGLDPGATTHAPDASPLTQPLSALGDALGGSMLAADALKLLPELQVASTLPAAASGFLGSGGTIAITDHAPSPTAGDDLFAAGRYTDYGVTLTTDAASTGSGVTQTLDQTVANAVTAVDIVHHDATSPAQPAADQHHDLIHGLDDFALRGSDGLL